MDLLKPLASRNVDQLVAKLLGKLSGPEIPSLAAAIGDPRTQIQLVYKAGRSVKWLRLTTEMGRRCDAVRRGQAQSWIAMFARTLGPVTVRDLEAIVPASTSGAVLEALYPALFGRLIWGERSTLSCLLNRVPASGPAWHQEAP